jgi:formate hydrogenlyase transcriptional activator
MVPFHRSVPRLAKLLMPREIEEMTSRLEDHSGGMQMPTAWQSAHGLARQITGRHERGLQTARAASRLKLLLDMTNTLVSHLDLRDLLRANSASIRQDMHCDVVGVWLPDGEQCQLRQLAMDFPEGKGFAEEDSLYPVEGSIVGRVLKTGKPFNIGTKADALNEREISQVRAEGIESGLGLPLISRNRALGVLTLGSRVENSFSPESVNFLVRAAGQAAIAAGGAIGE